jgi:bacterioferritin-associated ferredoxin
MGVDVFSAGEIGDKLDGSEVIRYEDPALELCRKLTLKDGKLAGFILVGDTADSHRYMDLLRTQKDLARLRRQLLFPAPVEDTGLDIAQMADSETVCGCMGAAKGEVIQAIHEQGIHALAQLKECTRASTGCGSCAGLGQSLLKAIVPEFEEEVKATTISFKRRASSSLEQAHCSPQRAGSPSHSHRSRAKHVARTLGSSRPEQGCLSGCAEAGRRPGIRSDKPRVVSRSNRARNYRNSGERLSVGAARGYCATSESHRIGHSWRRALSARSLFCPDPPPFRGVPANEESRSVARSSLPRGDRVHRPTHFRGTTQPRSKRRHRV